MNLSKQQHFAFFDQIMANFLARMHQRPLTDNYDGELARRDGVDRSALYNLPAHKKYLYFFIQNHPALAEVHAMFSDERSKKLFVDLILYRLLGHLHYKLDTNNPQFWKLKEMAKQLPSQPSSIEFESPFGPIRHFAGIPVGDHSLTLDCWAENLAHTFFIRQYYYESNGVRIQPEAGDHVIDGGACFGDTALAFAADVGSAGRVYTFDPLPPHAKVIQKNLAQNPALAGIVDFFPVGIGATSNDVQEMSVDAGQFNPSFNVTKAEGDIPVRAIDRLVDAGSITRVDFIKMDIEGSELAALQGAEKTLRKFKPKLAISLYHQPEDFFKIPQYIDKLGLGYRFHLDHYTIHGYETIMYAVAS